MTGVSYRDVLSMTHPHAGGQGMKVKTTIRAGFNWNPEGHGPKG
jgi:hypothetical protein